MYETEEKAGRDGGQVVSQVSDDEPNGTDAACKVAWMERWRSLQTFGLSLPVSRLGTGGHAPHIMRSQDRHRCARYQTKGKHK